MKKLLLVLLVVTLASFLFVGCIPSVPAEGEGEGEGEAGLCPTVTFSDSVDVDGKTYVKSGVNTTITVTYATPTVLAGVYIGDPLKSYPVGVPEWSFEVVMYTEDGGLTYTGATKFYDTGEPWCDEAYVYVVAGDPCCPVVCKYPLTVDGDDPYAKIEVCIDDCVCAGCTLSFTSTVTTECTETVNCGDDCSGLASWSIVIYDEYPFEDCCEVPCEEAIDFASGTECPIDFTTACLEFDKLEYGDIFVLVTLVDNVGNDVKYGAWVGTCDYDTCETIWVGPFGENDCLDDAGGVFSICDDVENCFF